MSDARHVTICPLTPHAVTGYLTRRFPGRDGRVRPRWQPVVDAVHAGHPVASRLTNPWELFLAVTAYTGEDTEPGDLLGLAPDQARDRLLDSLIPATVAHDPTAANRGWTSNKIHHWLTVIAHHQHHAHARDNQTDIYLPDLWTIPGTKHPRWTPAALAALPVAVLGGALYWTASTTGDQVTACFTTVMSVWLGLLAGDTSPVPLFRLAPGKLSTRHGRRKAVRGLAVGLASGLAVGLAVALAVGLASGGGNIWIRYGLAMRSATRHGLLPKRPAQFLDWCLTRGLMRMSGNAIQYRHRQFHEWLASGASPTSSPPTAPASPHPGSS